MVIEEISRLVFAHVLSPAMGIEVCEVLKANFTTAVIKALASRQLTLCIHASTDGVVVDLLQNVSPNIFPS